MHSFGLHKEAGVPGWNLNTQRENYKIPEKEWFIYNSVSSSIYRVRLAIISVPVEYLQQCNNIDEFTTFSS